MLSDFAPGAFCEKRSGLVREPLAGEFAGEDFS